MQVTSLLSREKHDHDHAHDHEHDPDCASCDHEHTPVRLKQTLLGLIFIVNAFLIEWLFDKGPTQESMVAHFSAMAGAIILGYPIVWTSFKDIRQGILSINELVGIAVLAAFASGQYEIAGLVAFFMLMGEII